MDVNAPFDLWQLSNELIGDIWLLLIVGLFATWYLVLKGKIGYKVGTMLSIIWLSIFFAQTNEILVWIIVVLAAGLTFYFTWSKAIRKG